jgi:hypothetical protein
LKYDIYYITLNQKGAKIKMLIENEVSAIWDKTGNSQTMVPIWFRVPKIWDDFLSEKADREYCSKSDLLRRAFRLTYDPELEEFRVNPERQSRTSHHLPIPFEKEEPPERKSAPNTFTLTLDETLQDY